MNTKVANRKATNKKVKKMRTRLSIMYIYGLLITIAFCALWANSKNYHDQTKKEKMKISMDYEAKIQDLEENNKVLNTKVKDLSKDLTNLYSVMETLDDQNKKLVDSNQQYYDELSDLRKRKELYDKYSYAIESDGTRTDITYDQLETLEQLMSNAEVNDQDLILAWIMTESGGQENATSDCSTAKGYGQFLDGTSKFVYTSLLGENNWSPSVALDGETNMKMMVAFVDYLYETSNRDLYSAIRKYRGRQDISGYVSKIDSYLSEVNKSVYQISLTLNG